MNKQGVHHCGIPLMASGSRIVVVPPVTASRNIDVVQAPGRPKRSHL